MPTFYPQKTYTLKNLEAGTIWFFNSEHEALDTVRSLTQKRIEVKFVAHSGFDECCFDTHEEAQEWLDSKPVNEYLIEGPKNLFIERSTDRALFDPEQKDYVTFKDSETPQPIESPSEILNYKDYIEKGKTDE